jgi:hypothetical protein
MSALAELHVFDFVRRDAVASAVRAGRLKYASWERWRPAGVFRCEAFPHPLAAGTAALPGLHPSKGGSLIVCQKQNPDHSEAALEQKNVSC